MVMYSPKLWIYLGETIKYTIVMIFSIENKCCPLGGLAVTRCYTLVIGHYKFYCIIMQWHQYLGYLLKQRSCGMYVNRMQGDGRYYNVVDIPIYHFVQRYSYRQS